MAALNKQVLLASRPQGAVTEENFRIVEAPLAKPAAGEVFVKNEWLSLDPYMRGRMDDRNFLAEYGVGYFCPTPQKGKIRDSILVGWGFRQGSGMADVSRVEAA